MPTKVEGLITLMEDFVAGTAISLADAHRLEGVLLECVAEHPDLGDLADDLAQYHPGGGDFLFDYARMKPKVASSLQALRTRTST
jgi:hypothetical protein